MVLRPTIYFILFILFIIPFFLKQTKSAESNRNIKELYSPVYSNVDNIEGAISFIDSIYYKKYSIFDTAQYVSEVTAFTKQRFFHGLSKYTIHDNWIAFMCGKIIWPHFQAIVEPNDILKHSEGLCSQQTIVFMEILKRRNIRVRSVGLGYKEGPGHFLSEVSYNNAWHLHDVTIEPQWEKVANHHKSFEYYKQNIDSLYLPYNNRLDRKLFNKLMEKVQYGKENEFPANNMLVFHRVTKAFTYILPVLCFLLFLKSLLKWFRSKSNSANQFKN